MDIWVTKRLMLVKTASCPSLSIVSFSYKKRKTFFGGGSGQNIQLLLTRNTILNEISQTETNKQTKNDIILRICGIEKNQKQKQRVEWWLLRAWRRGQSFPASGSFPMSQLLESGGQSIGVSASTSVLPMNTQD